MFGSELTILKENIWIPFLASLKKVTCLNPNSLICPQACSVRIQILFRSNKSLIKKSYDLSASPEIYFNSLLKVCAAHTWHTRGVFAIFDQHLLKASRESRLTIVFIARQREECVAKVFFILPSWQYLRLLPSCPVVFSFHVSNN